MISLFISIISVFFWLGIEIISIGFIIFLDLCTIIVNILISLLCGTASAVISHKSSVVVNKQPEYRPRTLSRRQQKQIDKKIKKEISRAQDDLEYDMLMMMEVCADD